MKLEREENESIFEHKLRLCLGKLNKDIDLDWCELVEILNETCSADHLRKMSYGYRQYNDYINGYTGVANRILSISDSHVPFQLDIENLEEYRDRVDTLVFNGDITDCMSLSKFNKNYRLPIMEELIKGREFMIKVIDYIKPKKVIVNYGNHDLRFGNYLAKKLDSDVLELMPDTALELICITGFKHYDKRLRTKVFYDSLIDVFKDTNIEIEYTYNWWCKVGKTIFAHPSAFSSGVSATSVKAMQYFLQEGHDFDTMVLGHTHQVSYTQYGKIHLYEQGCFCESSEMTYTDGKLYKSQTNGILYLTQDEEGKTIYDKTKLVLL